MKDLESSVIWAQLMAHNSINAVELARLSRLRPNSNAEYELYICNNYRPNIQ